MSEIAAQVEDGQFTANEKLYNFHSILSDVHGTNIPIVQYSRLQNSLQQPCRVIATLCQVTLIANVRMLTFTKLSEGWLYPCT